MLLNQRLSGVRHYARNFYAGRLIRLLPCYYMILLVTFWLVIVGPRYLGFEAVIPKLIDPGYLSLEYERWGLPYIIFNLIPIVPETFRFYDFDHRRGVLFLLLIQTWSLSAEYVCLLIAPTVLRNRKLYYPAILFFSASALHLATKGIYRDYVWSMVIFFLLGSVAFRIYRRWFANRGITNVLKSVIVSVLSVLVVYLFYFGYIEKLIGSVYAYGIFMVIAFLSLPILFTGSRTFLRDRFLGDLAYPMYLNHVIILWVLLRYGFSPIAIFWLTCILSIGLAFSMYVFIDRPLQRWRQRSFYRTVDARPKTEV